MLEDPEAFAFPATLEARAEVFRRDLERLRRDDFVLWPQPGAYSGAWRLFPLYLDGPPPGFLVDCRANRARCPESARVLASIDGLASGAFSWLDAGTRIHEHVDAKEPGVVRCHLALRVPRGSWIRVGGQVATWREGRCLIVDGRLPHEIVNDGSEPRIVLIVDVRHPARASVAS